MTRLNLLYNVKEDKFTVNTDLKDPKDMVSEFLRLQIGAGVDKTEPNRTDEYYIKIQVDLAIDGFTCEHNCGNLGLRDGILMRYLK